MLPYCAGSIALSLLAGAHCYYSAFILGDNVTSVNFRGDHIHLMSVGPFGVFSHVDVLLLPCSSRTVQTARPAAGSPEQGTPGSGCSTCSPRLQSSSTSKELLSKRQMFTKVESKHSVALTLDCWSCRSNFLPGSNTFLWNPGGVTRFS